MFCPMWLRGTGVTVLRDVGGGDGCSWQGFNVGERRVKNACGEKRAKYMLLVAACRVAWIT